MAKALFDRIRDAHVVAETPGGTTLFCISPGGRCTAIGGRFVDVRGIEPAAL